MPLHTTQSKRNRPYSLEHVLEGVKEGKHCVQIPIEPSAAKGRNFQSHVVHHKYRDMYATASVQTLAVCVTPTRAQMDTEKHAAILARNQAQQRSNTSKQGHYENTRTGSMRAQY